MQTINEHWSLPKTLYNKLTLFSYILKTFTNITYTQAVCTKFSKAGKVNYELQISKLIQYGISGCMLAFKMNNL